MAFAMQSKMVHIRAYMKLVITSLFVFIYALPSTASAQITVFAASSTTEAMKEIGKCFTDQVGEKVRFNFASSGTLARQIEAGAPADVFVSANVKWMDYLEDKAAVEKDTRFNLATNALVLVAPKGSSLAFDGTISGRLSVGDFKSVPAGIYAREALEHMGWIDTLKPKLVMGSNVRTVLMYVERGETVAGIVYATDAQASEKVVVIGTFPEESHSPIIYPATACSEKEVTTTFMSFLKSLDAKTILRKHGFK
jgi:molybdate transport system substrate-binding protein